MISRDFWIIELGVANINFVNQIAKDARCELNVTGLERTLEDILEQNL